MRRGTPSHLDVEDLLEPVELPLDEREPLLGPEALLDVGHGLAQAEEHLADLGVDVVLGGERPDGGVEVFPRELHVYGKLMVSGGWLPVWLIGLPSPEDPRVVQLRHARQVGGRQVPPLPLG